MVQIKIDASQIDLDTLCMLESWAETGGGISFKELRDFVRKYAVDDGGNRLEGEEAVQAVGKLTLAQLNEVIASLNKAIGELSNIAVPPQSGG